MAGAEQISNWVNRTGLPIGVNAPDVQLGTLLSGEDTENNRLMTYELWDYGDGNVTPATVTAEPILKAAPGVLGTVQVLAEDDTETLTLYDAVVTPDGDTPVLAIIPLASGSLGKQYHFGRPFSDGLYAVFSAGSDSAVVAVGRL